MSTVPAESAGMAAVQSQTPLVCSVLARMAQRRIEVAEVVEVEVEMGIEDCLTMLIASALPDPILVEATEEVDSVHEYSPQIASNLRQVQRKVYVAALPDADMVVVEVLVVAEH